VKKIKEARSPLSADDEIEICYSALQLPSVRAKIFNYYSATPKLMIHPLQIWVAITGVSSHISQNPGRQKQKSRPPSKQSIWVNMPPESDIDAI